MSYPVYMVPSGDVLPVFFHTFDGGTGASITLTGLAVTDIEIYKDGSATQRASDAGYTLLDTDGIDFDGITGIHGFSIDTGDNTDAGFYTVGSWFHVVVSSVTVDGQTVNFIACAFRLMAAESVAAKPKVDVDAWLGTAAATPTTAGVPEVDVTHWLGTAAATPTVAGVPEVDATHFGGTAGTFASGRPEVNTTHIGGTAQTANDVGADVNDILTDTADMQPKLGTPAGASISADIAAIEAQTDDIGAAGAGLTAITSLLPAALTAGGNMKSDVLAVSGDTTAADRLEGLMDGVLVAQVNDVGATTTAFIADGFTEATNDHFNGRLITFISGALSGQQTDITDYVGATQTFTVTALTEAPADDDFFVIH